MILIYFLFWSFIAHTTFAHFMEPPALMGPPGEAAAYPSGPDLAMSAVQLLLGAACAFLLFALTAFALPMLLDRKVDFGTAMRDSLAGMRANLPVMTIWATVISVSKLGAMVPWFLEPLAVLPVLGHASWHPYRRAMACWRLKGPASASICRRDLRARSVADFSWPQAAMMSSPARRADGRGVARAA